MCAGCRQAAAIWLQRAAYAGCKRKTIRALCAGAMLGMLGTSTATHLPHPLTGGSMQASITGIFRRLTRLSTLYQVLSFGLDLLAAWLISRVLAAAIDQMWPTLWGALPMAAAAILLGGLLLMALSRRCNRTSQDSLHAYRQWVCAQTILGTIAVPTTGELDARLQGDADTILTFYGSALPRMIASGLIALVCLMLLLMRDARLMLIFALLSFLQLLPAVLYEGWAKAVYRRTMEDIESYSNWMAEGLSGIRTVKSYRQEAWFLQRFRQNNRALIQSGRREAQTATVEEIVASLIGAVLTYGSYVILGLFVLRYGIAAARVPLLLVLSQHLFGAVAAIVRSRVAQFRYQQAVKRLGEWTTPKELLPVRSGDAMVSAAHIAKAFGDKAVLSDVSLRIDKGQRVLLTGANGAGKTTLMRILLGLLKSDAGQVESGAIVSAFAFQDDPPLNLPAQDIADALVAAGMIDKEAFTRHMQAFSNLSILDKSPMDCSSGQRKKFYLAIALARNADFLVLDEPTNHLDADSVQHLLAHLGAYTGTLLVCTHQARLNLQWDSVYHMAEGKLHGV